jgi:sugar phosphate isomerase/epimerase
MKINNSHLCYSLNVYPGTTWLDKFEIIKEKLVHIKQQVTGGADNPFAIGLWLDCNSVNYLQDATRLADFKQYLCEHNYYVFTVNAFPYGVFHNTCVKEKVYQPDWTTRERMEYTCKVAEILAELLPEGINGSISTLPGGYKAEISTPEQMKAISTNLLLVADYLKKLEKHSGRRIELAVEMEPDCLWENPQEFACFFQHNIAMHPEAEYIGVCYDTCHQELTGNQPGEGIHILRENGITIAKVQLSAGIQIQSPVDKVKLKEHFNDTVYLHQTRLFTKEGNMVRYPDLPIAVEHGDINADWVIHYHIPVYCEELIDKIGVANQEVKYVLDMAGNNILPCSHLEIETYTYNVLPDKLKMNSLESSIAEEYNYVIDRLSE